MKKYKILTATLIGLTVNSFYGQYGDRGFWHNTNSNTAFLTAAKKMTIGYNGYAWAGVYPAASGTAVDFTVEKVNTSSWCLGCMWSFGSFSKDYLIQADPSCTSPINMPYPHNMIGVDMIEVPAASGANEQFALAGTFGGGILFAALNASGNVTANQFWAIPGSTSSTLGKPSICKAANNQSYYICGTWKQGSYVIKVRYDGLQLWSKYYNNMWIEARDIIESPTNSNELIVVGKCQYNLYAALDAFFLVLNSGNGAVINFTAYNDGITGDEWFNSIEPASAGSFGGPGYIVGGRVVSQYNTPMIGYTPWMIKLDPAGNVIWSTLIPHYSEITDVCERWNPLATPQRYEYFGVAQEYPSAGTHGLIVWKLDEFGVPSVPTPNVFQYSLNGTIASVNDVTWPQVEPDGDGTGGTDGLACWGTDYSNNRFKIERSYYNGYSGCESLSDMSVVNGPVIAGYPTLTSTNFVNTCYLFLLTVSNNPNANYNWPCSWTSSVPGGSNLRTSNTTGLEITSQNATEQVSVYPNPSNGVVAVELGSYTGPAQIKIMNAMGQLIKTLEFSEEQLNNQKVSVDFQEMKLSEGLYFMDITVQNQTQTKKIVYKK